MMRRYSVSLSILFLLSGLFATTIAACGESEDSADGSDTTAAATATAAADSLARIATIDSAIAVYVVAADSLASLFDRLETVEQVEQSRDRIAAWSGTIRDFQGQSARYGELLVVRMARPNVDSAVQHLIRARDSLQRNPDVYARVSQIEDAGASAAR